MSNDLVCLVLGYSVYTLCSRFTVHTLFGNSVNFLIKEASDENVPLEAFRSRSV